MITLKADSIAELNQLYRQVKNRFQAVDTIKVDPDGLMYTMQIEKKSINPFVKNLLDKVIDWCEEELESLPDLTQETVDEFLVKEAVNFQFANQLFEVWSKSEYREKELIVGYLDDHLLKSEPTE